MIRSKSFIKNPNQQSFTLLETMIAVVILSSMILQFVTLQGNVVYFNEYAQKSNKAIWLAKRVMSQIELMFEERDFASLERESEDEIPFPEHPGFTYRVSVTPWKLPIVDLITGGSLQKEEGEANSESAEADPIAAAVKNFLGDDLLRVAYVEVFWPEGVNKNSVSLTYLLANHGKLDQVIAGFSGAYAKLNRRSGAPTTPGDPGASNPNAPVVPGQFPQGGVRPPKNEERVNE